MNWTLLAKEIVGLRLVLWLAAIMFGLDIVYDCTTTFPDYPEPVGDERSNSIASMLLFGIVIGVMSMNQERNHQTIPFLDGLPVSRGTLFLHKILAAMLVGAILPAFGEVLGYARYWLTTDSPTKPYSLSHSVARLSMEILLSTVIIGWASFLSVARNWFPLAAALVVWLFLWFRMTENELSPYLDTFAMLDVTDSQDMPSDVMSSAKDVFAHVAENHEVVRLPWRQIVGHSVLGSVAWTAAYIAFQTRDGWFSRMVDRVSAWKFAGALTILSQLIAVGLCIAAMGWMQQNANSPGDMESLAAGTLPNNGSPSIKGDASLDSFGRYESERYEVIFKESQRELVHQYFWSLDSTYNEVQAYFLNAEGPSGRIVLDTASLVSSHASGQANWTKIRVPLNLHAYSGSFLDTVRHETAHVFIESLSQGEASAHANAMRMFHEGVATAVELSVSDTSESNAEQQEAGTDKIRNMERWVAGVDARGRIPFDELCDDARLSRARDPFVVYPLGYIVSKSLVESGGPELPRKMLETLGKTSFPPGISPIELWRIVLKKCGVSLDLVIGNYEETLDQLANRESEFLAGLPRVKGSVVVEVDWIVIKPTVEGEASMDATLVCQIERDRVLTKIPEYAIRSDDGSFRIQRSSIASNKIRYILGWVHPNSANTIFEPWQEASIPMTGPTLVPSSP